MILRRFLTAAPILLVAISPAIGGAETITGRASVIDGDTIEIRGERIRLHDVDAPESWQKCEDGDGGTYRCGKEAALDLDRFLAASRPARCEVVERDRYKRFVSICFRADGREVNRWLVESGNAVDWERYSKGAYTNAHRTARARGAGIWRGKFQLPCQARAERAKRDASC
ncbi:succinoglycan biosynthesis protein ExoI [Sinorhizobium fredii NGR234]|uniref:Succinoglycan biosynthesis protein ExoI n=1 Tax=Sinorhizobium fredii (strain NBRC 101917 / NGR234) TaxID=394 RepID=C3MAU3_SINFN|nr:thermonuclease family protein [Sinorhizobium fredii]ACP24936.1 succinoglycan biosynthesis protein ExoI [Sinorhizobium fredii NGR234]